MKKTLLFVAICILSCFSLVQAQQKISPVIQEVTVFSNAAEIKSLVSFTANSGLSTIVCIDIPGNMVNHSLKLNPSEGIEITGFSIENYQVPAEQLIPGHKQMTDSLSLLNNNIITLRNRFDAYNTEKNMLLANQKIGGNNTGTSTAELRNMADFYRERILLINNELSKIQEEIRKVEEKIVEINNRMLLASNKVTTSRKRIIIDVSVATSKKADIEIRYIVGKCGWSATYDLLAEDLNMPVTLKYKANVLNNSGIDWNNVQLILSTLDPLKGASAPVLTPWYLSYSSNYDYNQNQQYRYSKSSNEYAPESQAIQAYDIVDQSQTYENVVVSELSTEFRIERKYTIPTDQKPFKIDITEYDLPADYKYITIPKMETKAYLLARITGWEKYDLTDGDMNVYFANSYIGVSRLNTNTLNDTLDLSLGRDNKIMITRIKLENFSSKSFLGNSRKESFAYEIQVKNNRNKAVNIEIIDQIPVSQESEIEVGVNDISLAEYNNTSGLLKWNTELQPGKSQKFTVSFWVKYPKNKPVQMARKRSVSAPKF